MYILIEHLYNFYFLSLFDCEAKRERKQKQKEREKHATEMKTTMPLRASLRFGRAETLTLTSVGRKNTPAHLTFATQHLSYKYNIYFPTFL